jgi:hypothetical protein
MKPPRAARVSLILIGHAITAMVVYAVVGKVPFDPNTSLATQVALIGIAPGPAEVLAILADEP